MEVPVQYQVAQQRYAMPGKTVVITSGFIELNPEYSFDIEEMKLVIPFVKAEVEPQTQR